MATVQYDAKTGAKLQAGQTTTDALGNVYKQGTEYAPKITSGSSTIKADQSLGGTSLAPAYNAKTGATTGTPSAEYDAYLKGLSRGIVEAPGTAITPKATATPVTPGTPGAPALTDQKSTAPEVTPLTPTAFGPNAPTGKTAMFGGQMYNVNAQGQPVGAAIAEKYKTGLATAQASGVQAPVAGNGASVISPYVPPTTAEPDNSAMEMTLAQDPGYQALLQMRKEYTDTMNQQTSLADEYNKIIKKSGLQAINTQLINTKNVIEGTEDDIRNEVTKAGGFATDSQVMALASARNKVLIKNYNNLLDTKQMIMENVNTMMGLAQQDRQNAIQVMNQKMNIDSQIIDYAQKMQTNAQNQYQKIADQVGYAGLAQMTKGDPYYTSLVEKGLGLNPGGLAQLAAQPNYSQEIQKAQLYGQQLENKKLEEELNMGAGSSGYNGEFAATIDLTSNLEKSVAGKKAIKAQLTSDIANKDYASAYNQILNTVQSNLSGTLASNFGQQRQDYNALAGLRQAISDYANSDGDMGLLTGTEEQIKRKLGIDSGSASRMAVQLWREFQTYRLNMTGAAFSPSESKDYASVNPTLGKSLNLNLNVIDGAMDQLENKVNSTVETYVPSSKYIREYALGETNNQAQNQNETSSESWLDKLSPEQIQELINEDLIQ